MSQSMYAKLQAALKDFELQNALILSDRLHEMEGKGHIHSQKVDRLWEQLTYKIETEHFFLETGYR